ncbi:MAG TPA: AraC family transcriptional regulator [Microvirga sp.]|nr:AraC family transcriptional regulator [Microvirga sp.]
MAYWREEFGRFVIKLDIDPLGENPFHCDVILTRMPGLTLMSGVCSQVQYRATASLISQNDDTIGIIRNANTAHVDHMNRESTLGTGDGTLLSWTDPLTFTLPAGAASNLVRLSRPVLQALAPGLNDAYNRVIPGQSDALNLLFGYLKVLENQEAVATPELQRILVTHSYDLAALALGASRDMAEVAKERGLRAARLRAIKEDISLRLTEPGLSLDGIALRHRVSPRYVQKLFEMEGSSFSDHVRAERLARTYRMLQDPRLSHLSISTIAYECGFGDITAFNRAFRKQYDASPSDVRHSLKAS